VFTFLDYKAHIDLATANKKMQVTSKTVHAWGGKLLVYNNSKYHDENKKGLDSLMQLYHPSALDIRNQPTKTHFRISRYRWLTELRTSNADCVRWALGCCQLKTLTIEARDITWLQLRLMPNIQCLEDFTISRCRIYAEELTKVTMLKTLCLYDCILYGLDDLSRLTNVKKLVIWNCKIKNKRDNLEVRVKRSDLEVVCRDLKTQGINIFFNSKEILV
jgi:hypothetical protein